VMFESSRNVRTDALRSVFRGASHALLALFCFVFFQIARQDAGAAVCAAEMKKYVFHTKPEGATISVSPLDMKTRKIIGKSGVHLLLDLSLLCRTEKLVLTFSKNGYDTLEVPVESSYLKSHSRYPAKGFLRLQSCYRRLFIVSRPSNAQVYIHTYSHPQAPVYLGTTGSELLLNTSGMATGEKYALSLRLRHFRDNDTITLTREQMLPAQLNYCPPSGKPVYLVPEWPVISHLLNWMENNIIGAMIAIPLSVAAISYLLIGVAIPSIRRSIERNKKEERWEALANRANIDDPRFGLRLGNYKLVESIGKGGMAEVYRAVPESTCSESESVAVKLIHGSLMDDPEFERRFRREIKISCELYHPNILHVLDFGEKDGLLYIVMEYVRGVTLKKKIPEGGLPLRDFYTLFRQILEAVQFAHIKGVCHRDLKPDNIMVTDQNRVVVMDFGLARRQDSTSITASGTTFGTPAYMAPEQVQAGSQDGRTDQYSLGCMAYEMLTGRIPFDDEIAINIMLKHVTDEPPPPRRYRTDLPGQIEEMVLKMLEKKPENRFPSLKEVEESLEGAFDVVRKVDGKIRS